MRCYSLKIFLGNPGYSSAYLFFFSGVGTIRTRGYTIVQYHGNRPTNHNYLSLHIWWKWHTERTGWCVFTSMRHNVPLISTGPPDSVEVRLFRNLLEGRDRGSGGNCKYSPINRLSLPPRALLGSSKSFSDQRTDEACMKPIFLVVNLLVGLERRNIFFCENEFWGSYLKNGMWTNDLWITSYFFYRPFLLVYCDSTTSKTTLAYQGFPPTSHTVPTPCEVETT